MQNQTTHTDLFLDIQLRPRDTENSRIVVKRWGENADPYSTTIPNAQPGEEQALKAFFAITAERLLYRSKVLALPIDNDFAASEVLQCARPFGQDGPNFASLYVPSVSIAMAFIPLTPEGDSGKPVLARLYCIKGLASSHLPPFADGADLSALARYSWFLAGLPDKLADEPVNGRSWLLAAHLLKAVLDRNQVTSTRKNLATSFIVTGDVENGGIHPVEMGRKPELATIKEYRNLKWIIPMKNTNDMNNVPSRLVEKPATLEEAYELIEAMQSRATKSFFRFLKKADLDGMKEQYANGADLFAEDEATGKSSLQLAAESIAEAESLPKTNDKGEVNSNRQKLLDKRISAKDWLNGQGVDCTMMLYILAKSRMLDVLDRCVEKFPINARDERGLTAVDWAIIAGDRDTALLLHSKGGRCDKNAKNNKIIRTAVASVCDLKEFYNQYIYGLLVSKDDVEVLKIALETGLNPDVDDLFSVLLKRGDVDLVKACLEAGREPNMPLANLDFGESRLPILAIAEDKACAMDEIRQEKLINALFEYGVSGGAALDNKLKHAMARSFVHKALRMARESASFCAKVLRALDDGSMSIEDKFEIGIHREDPNVICEYDPKVYGSLFALSLSRCWLDVIRKCLEKGVSATDVITTTYVDDDGIESFDAIEESCTPMEFVRKHCPQEMQGKIIDLLRSYMPPVEIAENMPF